MSSCEIVSEGSSFSALAKQSWNALKGNWLISIGAFSILLAIQYVTNYIPFSGLLLSPLHVGIMLFMLHVVRKDCGPDIAQLFEPFNQYWRYVWGYLRVIIFVFLWALLLIIPGIIAGYRYAMTFYIMLDNPRCTAKEAMTESCEIMYGHKMQLFGYGLLLSLICVPLAIFTLGIGLIWLIPWSNAFMAAFYDSVRRRPAEPALLQETIEPGQETVEPGQETENANDAGPATPAE